jgi:hypothetical protein
MKRRHGNEAEARPSEVQAGSLTPPRQRVGKMLLSIFFSKEAILAFVIKMVRLTLCIISLNLVSMLFKQWFENCRDAAVQKLPSLHAYVAAYYIMDFIINIIVSLMCMVISVGNNVSIATNLDYIISFAFSLKMSWSSATYLTDLMQTSQSLDYRVDGLELINTQTNFISSIVVMNMFIPYYLIVLGLIPKRNLHSAVHGNSLGTASKEIP